MSDLVKTAAPAAQKQTAPASTAGLGKLQRKCACGGTPGPSGECAACRKKRLGLQRQAAGPAGPATAPPIVHEVIGASGRPLEAATRTFMETRMGHDFSQVRVHSDARAAQSAWAVGALAYTVGRNIVFGAGQYAPGTGSGRRLLAHELAHVAQQSGASGHPATLEIGPPDDAYEREADRVAEGAPIAQATQVVQARLQRSPDVGFTVHSLDRNRGQLDDPEDDGAGNVSWPLSFAVTSPLEASADVEVTGVAGDPCTDHEVGWLQTVHTQWLHLNYWGQRGGDGATFIRYNVALPIRDGDPGSMWYSSTGHEAPTACGAHVNPGMDDYPTLFTVPKVRNNTTTAQPNYLRGVSRGIHFVTSLVAQGPAGVESLRFFYWNYQMDIEFQPNHAAPNAAWPFVWKTNTANLGRVHSGESRSVPIFTNASATYNASLNEVVTERA